MNRDDFVKLVGTAQDDSQSVPVAFLLGNGYACAGFYHAAINQGLTSTCVLLNARLIELESKQGGRASINDFNDFLEEVVVDFCDSPGTDGSTSRGDTYGKTIPLTAIPYDQIAVVYPVAHIGALLRRAGQKQQQEQQVEERQEVEPHEQPQQRRRPPGFLDLDRSEILNLIRTKLW
jgi:hypothetical protein